MKQPLTEAQMAREIHRAKRANYIALGILLCLFTAIAVGVLLYRSQHTFTTEKWLADPAQRTAIVNDLLLHVSPLGKTEAEVRACLGPPDQQAPTATQGGRLVYYLGPSRGLMSIDSEWLLLDLTGGVVTACAITTD